MNKRLLAAILLSGLAGCATLECDTDWYQTGRRDGVLGADTQIENYAARCGGKIDRARYLEGVQAGLAMRPRISAM